MQAIEVEICSECSGAFVDAGDELVCPKCGVVQEKPMVEPPLGKGLGVRNLLKYPLGSRIGTKGLGREMSRAAISSGDRGAYERMKVIEASVNNEGGIAIECDKVIVRVSEKLFLPPFIALEAMSISRKVISASASGRRMMVAEVSAYSLVAACKIEGITTASIREILRAYASLGRRVTSSSLNKLTLDSPVRTFAKKPEEYLTRVLAKLMMNRRLEGRLERERVSATEYSNSLREAALRALGSADKFEMSGKRPCALAASAVFSAEVALSLHESRSRRFTQKDVAECGDASEYTVREQCATIFAPEVIRPSAGSGLLLPLQTTRQSGR